MAPQPSSFPPLMISAKDLATAGITLDPIVLHRCALEMFRDLDQGLTFGTKAVLLPNEEEFWAVYDKQEFRQQLVGERLGWKLSALPAVGPRLASVKIVGANAANRLVDLPRSTSTLLLFDKFTMQPLCIFEASTISAARTATYASVVAEWLLSHKAAAKIFLFGGGPIARRIATALAEILQSNLETLWVRTRSLESARDFCAKHSEAVPALVPVGDNMRLCEADLVITATNAKQPVFDIEEINDHAAVLQLGGDETPAKFLSYALENGNVLCDDLGLVSHRNSQSLALYFSRRGLTLEDQGPGVGIGRLGIALREPADLARPTHITCVGLPSLDLYVGEALYQSYTAWLDSSGPSGQGMTP